MAWGDESPIQFQALDGNGDPYDLTGLTVYFQLRITEGVRGGPILISKSTADAAEIDLTTPASGLGEVYLVAADWARLSEGNTYYCAFWLIDANGRHRPFLSNVPFVVTLTPFAQADV